MIVVVLQARGTFDMKEPYYRQLNAYAQLQAVPQATTQQQVKTIPGLSVAVGDISTADAQLQQQQQQQGEVGGLQQVAAEGGAAAGAAGSPVMGAAGNNGAAQSAAAGFYALAV